jgi:hypothetical protein
MNRCRAEIPPLTGVGALHRSACWLPSGALGLDDVAEQRRKKAAEAGRAGQENAE